MKLVLLLVGLLYLFFAVAEEGSFIKKEEWPSPNTETMSVVPELPADFEFIGTQEDHRLFQACKEGDFNLLQSVLTSSEVNQLTDTGGRPPLIWAARYNHPQLLEALLLAGADVNSTSLFGCSSLMWAARNGNCPAIETLLFHGADIDAINEDGDTALHEAVRYNHIEAVRILIVNGANTTIRNKGLLRFDWEPQSSSGHTPYDEAKLRGYKEIEQLFRTISG